MPDDFILTLDSDSETENVRPTSSKRAAAKPSKQAKPEETEEFALDNEFQLDFSSLGGSNLRKGLADGVDFWEADDEVKGGKLVSRLFVSYGTTTHH